MYEQHITDFRNSVLAAGGEPVGRYVWVDQRWSVLMTGTLIKVPGEDELPAPVEQFTPPAVMKLLPDLLKVFEVEEAKDVSVLLEPGKEIFMATWVLGDVVIGFTVEELNKQ